MKTASALPPPLRVTEPVSDMEVADWYTPDVRVEPPRSLGAVVKGVRPAASRYAAVVSFFAKSATALVRSVVPALWTPGGKPVIEVPGLSPMSPEITEEPVLVMAEPARTANDDAVPRLTVGVAACTGWMPKVANARQESALRESTPMSGRRRKRTAAVRGGT
jgi:hypothetical protein